MDGSWGSSYDQAMLRPESWSRLTGGSPVRVGTGAPGSRPRFVVERRRAERGVESLATPGSTGSPKTVRLSCSGLADNNAALCAFRELLG